MVVTRSELPLKENIRIQLDQDWGARETFRLADMEFHTWQEKGQLKNRWSWLSLPLHKLQQEVGLIPKRTSRSSVESLPRIASQEITLHFGIWAGNHTRWLQSTLGQQGRSLFQSEEMVNSPLDERIQTLQSSSPSLVQQGEEEHFSPH